MRTGKKAGRGAEVEMKVYVLAYIREGYVSGRDIPRKDKRMAALLRWKANAVLSEQLRYGAGRGASSIGSDGSSQEPRKDSERRASSSTATARVWCSPTPAYSATKR